MERTTVFDRYTKDELIDMLIYESERLNRTYKILAKHVGVDNLRKVLNDNEIPRVSRGDRQ